MLELDDKYVFHIPRYKYVNNELVPITRKSLIKELINDLEDKGHHSFYVTKAKGYYKGRCFDELLFTLFVSEELLEKNQQLPSEIFKNWFKRNNYLLKQEAFAYEHNNSMIIEKID